MNLNESHRHLLAVEIAHASKPEAWGYLYVKMADYLNRAQEQPIDEPLKRLIRKSIRFEKVNFYREDQAFWRNHDEEKPATFKLILPVLEGKDRKQRRAKRLQFLHLQENDSDNRRHNRNPLELLIKDEAERCFEDACNQLGPRELQAIIAKSSLSGSRSVREISLRWRCSKQRVYQLANRAVKQIQKQLVHQGVL